MKYGRNRKDAKRAARAARKGDELWVIVDCAQNLAPYEDAQLVQRHKVTGSHPLLGGAMIGGTSVEDLVLTSGPVYTSRPAGYRAVHEPTPQVPAPLSGKEDRPLTKQEIHDLENRFGRRQARRMLEKAGAR